MKPLAITAPHARMDRKLGAYDHLALMAKRCTNNNGGNRDDVHCTLQ
jgi:hypothetical protein